jgi:hypothetical protein
MTGKGVQREASLITLKDLFIDAYLEICEEVLGKGTCGWELSILASALKKTLPGVEYKYYKSAPKRSEKTKLFPYIWNLLTEYSMSVKTVVNEESLIPNIDKSNTLLGLLPDKNDLYFSKWNFKNLRTSLKKNKEELINLHNFISQSDDTRPFIYLRAKILNSDQHIFLVRHPENIKPFFLLKSPVDEINVTEILTLLKNRGDDIGGNPNVIPVQLQIEEVEKTVVREIEETIDRNTSKKQKFKGQLSPRPPLSVQNEQKNKKQGFFSRIFSRFRTSKSKTAQSSQKAEKPKEVKKEVKKGKKTVKEKIKVKKEKHPSSNIPDFISYALGVAAVGDLNLFQLFDTVRESNYAFSGVLYSDFKNNSSTFYASKTINNPKSLTKILDGLDMAVERVINHFEGDKVQIMPKEILFRGRTIDTNFVLIFEGNEDHLVGIMGSTYVKDETTYAGPEEEEETFQRRTLKMRTNQLLNTLKSVHRFDEVFTRVLGEELLKQCQEYKFEHAILNIYS